MTRGRRVPAVVASAPRGSVSADAVLLNPNKYLEPVTDALISELVAVGWERARLLEARAMGLLYARARNSFFTMPEYVPA